MNKKKIGLGIIGFGTVGAGVVRILRKNIGLIEQKVGARCQLISVCDKDIKSKRHGVTLSRSLLTTDYQRLLKNPSIDIIIELIGGYEPARRIVLDAIRQGKHIVTANKAILSKYWNELFSNARQYKRLIYFEAAVGGGIPVVQALNEGLAANRIQKIIGILNGTTNFILSQMSHENLSYSHALNAAVKAGFAEPDARFDVQGIDASHKLSILASIAAGSWVKPGDFYCEG
ncbi:MAG: homoserine dehydrogenase, partial [Elusimicrobia bacterium]|nr:homoserine dehydrogenase [Elusimicrobiota bacterium]MBD3411936.1 homoserine dehydrogenase [Elusimicrobiota bacterium]